MHGLMGIEVEPIGAVVRHGHHPMLLFTGSDDAHHAGDALRVGLRDRVDRPLDAALHFGVQGGTDQVAVSRHLLLAETRASQVFQCVLAKERPVTGGDATLRQRVGLGEDTQRLGPGSTQFIGPVGQILHHGVKYEVAPGKGCLGVGIGVECAGGLHHPGQQRRLLPVELPGVDAEVRACRILNAVRAITECHEVQIPGQDLRLRECLVQGQRRAHLAQLARRRDLHRGPTLRVGPCLNQKAVVLDVLLLDRRPAPSVIDRPQVSEESGQGALQIHAVVLAEALVLDRDDRQLHGVGDPIAGQRPPALGVQPGDRVPLGVNHGRYLRHVAAYEFCRVLGHRIGDPHGQHPDTAGQRKHQRRDE